MTEKENPMAKEPELLASLMDAGESDDSYWNDMSMEEPGEGNEPEAEEAPAPAPAEESPTPALTSSRRTRKNPAKAPEATPESAPTAPARERITSEEFLRRQESSGELLQLISAYRSGRVIRATIHGVTDFMDRLCFVSFFESATIYTPVEELYQDELLDRIPFPPRNTKERSACKRSMNKNLNANIPLILTNSVSNSDGQVIFSASCRKAMEAIKKLHFSKNPSRPVKEGDVVECPVLNADSHCIFVEAFGMHVRVNKGNLSLRYIENADALYRPGNTIKLSVLSIIRSGNTVTDLLLSRRPIEAEACRKNIHRFVRNTTYVATITSIKNETRNGEKGALVSMFIDGIGLPAFSRSWKSNNLDDETTKLHIGDSVIFRGIGLVDVYIHGEILKILP